MSDFTPYTEPSTPTMVQRIFFTIASEMVEDRDEFSNPLGTYTETEFIEGTAVVLDQNGEVYRIHNAFNYQEFIDKGVFTLQELQAIRTWLQNVRDTVEGMLLPSP